MNKSVFYKWKPEFRSPIAGSVPKRLATLHRWIAVGTIPLSEVITISSVIGLIHQTVL